MNESVLTIVFSFVGGLALFLFGMNVLGDALRSLTGEQSRVLIGKLCKTPLRGVLLGAAVTALIQSSTAATVTVIGFVNSGMMTLGQSVGLILGANLGTTVTPWLLALTEIDAAGPLAFLDPGTFVPVLGAAGILLTLMRRSGKRRQIGTSFLGFAVLLHGLEQMSAAVRPLAGMPGFVSLLTAFSRPLPGFLAGVLVTALIQSSSASVGILGALAATGAITVGGSIPIILGQNVGTCVTTLLSGASASKNARRASLIHLYFNLIGAALTLAVFLTAKALLAPALFDRPAGLASIAAVHTLFNVLSLAVLLPFSSGLERLAVRTVPDAPRRKRRAAGQTTAAIPPAFEGCSLLDERFLALPAFALTMCRAAVERMTELCAAAVAALGNHLAAGTDENTRIAETTALTDGYYAGLNRYLALLAAGNVPLRERETQLITRLLTESGELYRIGELIREALLPLGQTPADPGETKTLADLCAEIARMLVPDAELPAPTLEAVLGEAARLRLGRLNALRDGKISPERSAALDAVTVTLEHAAAHAERLRNAEK